ncbi:MAG TPA: alpha/beta hydrolase [Fulvivirga sp.]|nr:alpha/beta hydrolase [Fulvivirga sp.]
MFRNIFMKGHFITFEKQQIHYYKMGNGPEIILAFHGFGLDGSSFLPFEPCFESKYTVYSFDLFYHGKSYWNNNNEPLSKIFWKEFIAYFLKDHKGKFSLLCFSLGGKFALATIEAFPERIDKVYFLAPDGIETSKWYSLATYPYLLRQYFKSMIVKPKRFFRIVNFLKSLRLMDKGILKFASSQMNTTKKRRRVYYSWLAFVELYFDLNEIARLINKNNIEVIMFLGEFDKIITEKGMSKLLRNVKKYDLHLLPCGHNHLISHAAEYLNQNR